MAKIHIDETWQFSPQGLRLQVPPQHLRPPLRQMLPDVQPKTLEAWQVHFRQRVRKMSVLWTRRRVLFRSAGPPPTYILP